jgi:hypothetical protein
LIIGYVENKAIGENLDRVLKSEQIARYRTLSENIVVTDYLYQPDLTLTCDCKGNRGG